VRAVEPRGGGGVLVTTAAGEALPFDRAIVTAGAWMGTLFARLGLPLSVTRQEVFYLRVAGAAESFSPARFPVWIDADALMYGCPSDGRIEGVKIAWHRLGDVADPDRPPPAAGGAGPGALDRVVAYAAGRLPDLSPDLTFAQTCLYTNTPDEDFILDRAPGATDIWIVSGCSGHGFKLTVLLGKMAADLATEARGAPAPRDLTRLALARFASG
jgi:sarcosine oxidase